MNEYLNKDCLKDIGLFSGFFGFNKRVDLKEKIEYFDKHVLQDLLVKQPELLLTNERFKLNLSYESFTNIAFSESFDGKIKISNFTKQIFSKSYRFNGDLSQRTKLFKSIFEQNENFLLDTHNYLINNNVYDDFQIFDFYFQSLKSKSKVKNNLDRNEILQNIDSFLTANDLNCCKKKINAYLNNFPKDMNTYNHIMEKMGDVINSTALVKIFWEDKLESFPKNIKDIYYQNNVQFSPFKEELSYHYRFSIDSQYIIQQTGVAQKRADDFKMAFYNSLSTFLLKTIQDSEKSNNSQLSGINFNFKTLEDRKKAQDFCNAVGSDLNSLLKSNINDSNYSNKTNNLTEYFDKLYLALSLNNELNTNNPVKKIKNKI